MKSLSTKYYIIEILFILILNLSSCKKEINKEQIPVKIDYKEKFIGKWEWKSNCGGLTGICKYPNNNYHFIIEFPDTSHYIGYYTDTLCCYGNCSIRLRYYPPDTSFFNVTFKNQVLIIRKNFFPFYLATYHDPFETWVNFKNKDQIQFAYGDVWDNYSRK